MYNTKYLLKYFHYLVQLVVPLSFYLYHVASYIQKFSQNICPSQSLVLMMHWDDPLQNQGLSKKHRR